MNEKIGLKVAQDIYNWSTGIILWLLISSFISGLIWLNVFLWRVILG